MALARPLNSVLAAAELAWQSERRSCCFWNWVLCLLTNSLHRLFWLTRCLLWLEQGHFPLREELSGTRGLAIGLSDHQSLTWILYHRSLHCLPGLARSCTAWLTGCARLQNFSQSLFCGLCFALSRRSCWNFKTQHLALLRFFQLLCRSRAAFDMEASSCKDSSLHFAAADFETNFACAAKFAFFRPLLAWCNAFVARRFQLPPDWWSCQNGLGYLAYPARNWYEIVRSNQPDSSWDSNGCLTTVAWVALALKCSDLLPSFWKTQREVAFLLCCSVPFCLLVS